MGFVCGTIGFGKKDGNTERPLHGSKSQRFGILTIRQLFNDGIPRLSLGQSKDGFSLLSSDDKIHFSPYGERCIGWFLFI